MDKDQDELAGCPWCDCHLAVESVTGEHDNWTMYSIVGAHKPGCQLVNAHTPEFFTKKEAIRRWNQRR